MVTVFIIDRTSTNGNRPRSMTAMARARAKVDAGMVGVVTGTGTRVNIHGAGYMLDRIPDSLAEVMLAIGSVEDTCHYLQGHSKSSDQCGCHQHSQ
jgi:hypothetical protein